MDIKHIAEKDTGSSNWIFPVVTLLIIFFQFPVSKIIDKKSKQFILLTSYLITALLFIPLSIITNFYTIILSIVGISIGTMMLLPSYQSISVNLAPSRGLVAAYLGFSNISMAIGGTLGNVLGGEMFDYLISMNRLKLFWIFMSLLSLFSVLIVGVNFKSLNRNHLEKVGYNVE